MTLKSNAHTHSTWCDGRNTTREMVEAALRLGFTDIGFSSHSPAPFDPECPGVQDEAAYRAEIAALREEYVGRIGVLCGMEQDCIAPVDAEKYDYIISSVHYLPAPDGTIVNSADGDYAHVFRTKEEWYKGDGLRMARHFYDMNVENAHKYRPDIIGHFDVITKTNSKSDLFDEQSAAYRNVALEALDAVIDVTNDYGGMIEVNTGGMGRRYLNRPYPDRFLLERMAERGTRPIITSDSHAAATLDFGFDVALALLRQAGFKTMAVLQNGCFVDVKI